MHFIAFVSDGFAAFEQCLTNAPGTEEKLTFIFNYYQLTLYISLYTSTFLKESVPITYELFKFGLSL